LLNVRLVSWFVLPTAVQLRTRPSLTTIKTDNRNFSEILPSNGLGPGPGEVASGPSWPKSPPITTSHKKSKTQNQKKIFSLQTARLVSERLNSFSSGYGARVMHAQSHVQGAIWLFSREPLDLDSCEGVN